VRVGDLIYHIRDWADKKPIVGIIVGFDQSFRGHDGAYRLKIKFTDRDDLEWWTSKELRYVERNEDR
jgi:hypothetical protein